MSPLSQLTALGSEQLLAAIQSALIERWAGLGTAAQIGVGSVLGVLLLGLAGRATTIRVEMQAANVAGPIRDNAQQLPAQPILDPAGPPSRAITFPGPRLVARLQAAGLPAELSTDAGQYLCNLSLYHTLGWIARLPPDRRPPVAGFIHLPPLNTPGPEGDPRGLTLDDEIRAIRLAIDTIVAAS